MSIYIERKRKMVSSNERDMPYSVEGDGGPMTGMHACCMHAYMH